MRVPHCPPVQNFLRQSPKPLRADRKEKTLQDSSPPSSPPAGAERGKTLIFHIGDHKTGSTSIQDAFATGRVEFPGHSLLYPAARNHNYLRDLLDTAEKGGKPGKTRKGMPGPEELVRMVGAAGEDFVLFSGEAFEGFSPDRFDEELVSRLAGPNDRVRIVAYVRPHAGRILSSYAEQIKIGRHGGTPDGFFARSLKSGRFFYAPRLRQWRDRFGDRFVVRPLIREQLHNGSVLDDFIRTGFGDIPCRVAPTPPSNESLSLRDLVMLRHLQAHLRKTGKGVRFSFGWDMARLLGEVPLAAPQERLQLHRALAERIRDAYRADAEAVDAEFFGGRGLFADALDEAVTTARATPQSLKPKDHFSPEELRDLTVMAKVCAAMLSNDAARWPTFFRQRRIEAMHRAAKEQ